MKKLLILGLLTLSMNGFAQQNLPGDFVEFGGCQQDDFVVIEETEVVIGTQGSSYTPQCIIVRPGTTVVIHGSTRHPLQAIEQFNGVMNPFYIESSEHIIDQVNTLTTPGYYGYFCTRHANHTTGRGMGGMIIVQEAN